MIYTVTLNPSIDYVVEVASFREGGLNRSGKEAYYPGGKGNNVSVVLKHFGVDSTALGFIAGFTGAGIERMLQEKGIQTDFIRLPEGNSRINLKMHSLADDIETELNGSGPDIGDEYLKLLFRKLECLAPGDTLVLAGSIPPSLPDSVYEEIGMRLRGTGVRLVADAEKSSLEKVLKYNPFLVKPNHKELGEMFNVEIRTKEEAVFYARKLQKCGAENIIVSMAGSGAVFLGKNGEVYQMDAPKGKVVNSVGSGDSMIAGFLASLSDATEDDMKSAFRMAVASGSACAFLQGLPERSDIERMMKKLGEVERL